MSSDPDFPVPSYSAFGEDRLIARLFRGLETGFYIDIGCWQPVAFSNTYLLYLGGWRGIAIDADPDAIAAFRRERPRDIALELAIGTKEGPVTLHRFSDSSMNTTSPDQAVATRANPRKRDRGQILVEQRRLSSVLDEHLPGSTTIDLLSVDCEGSDLDVLASNDWGKYRPTIVAVEDFDLNLAKISESPICRFMASCGYRLQDKLHLTAFYRRI